MRKNILKILLFLVVVIPVLVMTVLVAVSTTDKQINFSRLFNSEDSKAAVMGNSYYVSVNGNDANAGTQQAPWQTITKAASSLSPGDTAVVGEGTYNERIKIGRPGITFVAQGTVTMQGFIVSANDTTIDGFHVDNVPASDWDGYGIKINDGVTNCTVKNNYVTHGNIGAIFTSQNSSGCKILNNKSFHNMRSGLDIRGSNQLAEGNEIWDTVQYADWPQGKTYPSGFQPDADGVLFFGNNNTFRNNYIHDVFSYNPDGTAVNSHTDCFQTWGQQPANNILMDGNVCDLHQIAQNAEQLTACYTTQDNTGPIVVQNSLLNCGVGFFIKAMGTSGSFTIKNNTIIGQLGQSPALYPAGIWVNATPSVVNATNNIIYNKVGDSFFTKNGAVITGGNNLAFRSDGKVPTVGVSGATLYDKSTDLWAIDPLFVGSAVGDYHLQTTSPACNHSNTYIGKYSCGTSSNPTVAVPTEIPPTLTPAVIPTAVPTAVPPTSTPAIVPTVAPTVAVPTAIPPTSAPIVIPTAVPPTSTPAPISALTSQGSKITVYAAGTPACGTYPTLVLKINGQTAMIAYNVAGNPKTRTFNNYTYDSPIKVTRNQIRVEFINDAVCKNSIGVREDRNLTVDRINVDGTDFQTESSSIYKKGVYARNSCRSGYYASEMLSCNGYIQY